MSLAATTAVTSSPAAAAPSSPPAAAMTPIEAAIGLFSVPPSNPRYQELDPELRSRDVLHMGSMIQSSLPALPRRAREGLNANPVAELKRLAKKLLSFPDRAEVELRIALGERLSESVHPDQDLSDQPPHSQQWKRQTLFFRNIRLQYHQHILGMAVDSAAI